VFTLNCEVHLESQGLSNPQRRYPHAEWRD
jgi:hypothetical protein